MKIIEKIFNIETGEETITEREETANEKKYREEREAQLAVEAQNKADYEALKASAKAKLIAGEPLTAAEADTLVI